MATPAQEVAVGGNEGMLVDHAAEVVTRENLVVDGPMLDAAAAGIFRLAAVRLARERPQTDAATAAGRDAAQALLGLAAGHDEAALRQLLRPDPRVDETTWTVACYQIGDLTPCALLDFASPVAAINELAGCGDASHVAAELVASTAAGTRWAALTRTGRTVSFQLPDGRSASDAARDRPGELSLAGQHWRDQLNGWAAQPGADEAAPVTTAPRRVDIATAAPVVERHAEARIPTGGADLEQALALVVEALRSLEVRSRPAGPANDDILSRLDSLDRRMSDFQASVEVALERRMQAMGNYAAELTRAFAAQQNATTARLEARLDELMGRFPSPLRTGAIELGAAPPAADTSVGTPPSDTV